MVNSWLTYTLDDIVEMKSEKVSSDNVDIHNYVSTENMLPDKEGIKTSSGIPEQDKYLGFIEGDILFSNIRTYFRKIWRAKFYGGASNDIIVFSTRDDNILDQTYLYYLLSDERFIEHTVRTAKGTKMPRGDKSAIKAFEFNLPSNITEQKSIAHVLGTLDDKIELNRQMNQTLEQMAQALYKSWFVDFDLVIDNALAAGNEIPEPLQERAKRRIELGDKRRPLPKDIQELFPNEFEYSGQLEKWVPRGWKVKPLEECLEINPALKLAKGTQAKHVDMKALPTEGYIINDYVKKKYTGGGAKFQQGDVLLARITPCLENGKTGIVDFLDEKEVAIGSTEFIVLRGKGEIKTPLVACMARETTIRNHCIQSMVGSSGRQRVQIAAFQCYNIALPKAEILKEFHCISEPYFTKMTLLSKEIKSLVEIRDYLLPMLISGKITIEKN